MINRVHCIGAKKVSHVPTRQGEGALFKLNLHIRTSSQTTLFVVKNPWSAICWKWHTVGASSLKQFHKNISFFPSVWLSGRLIGRHTSIFALRLVLLVHRHHHRFILFQLNFSFIPDYRTSHAVVTILGAKDKLGRQNLRPGVTRASNSRKLYCQPNTSCRNFYFCV